MYNHREAVYQSRWLSKTNDICMHGAMQFEINFEIKPKIKNPKPNGHGKPKTHIQS